MTHKKTPPPNFKESINLKKQRILLTTEAFIEKSCDTLFSTQKFENKSVTFWSPFLESIFYEILATQPLYKSLIFRGVSTCHNFLTGIYDFSITKIKRGNEICVEWLIYDFTEFYQTQINYQQLFQTQEIEKQIRTA